MRVIFQIVLIAVIVIVALYFLTHNTSRTQAYKKILAITLLIFSVLAVVFPSYSDIVAQFIGVENGTALILYLALVAILYLFVRISIERTSNRRNIAQLVRKIAILEQQISQKDNKSKE